MSTQQLCMHGCLGVLILCTRAHEKIVPNAIVPINLKNMLIE